MKSPSLNYMVGGIQPLTMIDYPGKMSSVLFAQGCNLRCRFCYNKTLLPDQSSTVLSWSEVLEFLRDRRGFIEAVVFSGGEPCRQESFISAVTEVKNLGFEVALHTNGFYPDRVRQALNENLIDFIAIDVKGSFTDYKSITGKNIDETEFLRLTKDIVDSGVMHEFRTTIHPQIVTEEIIMKLSGQMADLGVKKYVLQKFQHGEALDRKLELVPSIWLNEINLIRLRDRFESFELRGDDIMLKKLNKKFA
ncbi:MAG: anaerobic ribonucleoside-triphosphate reductase activating protein [Candidatus Rifleibacteriota bacterium]